MKPLFFFLLFPVVLNAQQPPGGSLAAATSAQIDSTVKARMQRLRIPAVSIAISRGERLVLERSYGMTDLENQVVATNHTRYRIASVAKPLTATAVMQLVERGQIDLDAPIQKYVPAFPTKAQPITVRQLLTHTSGIRHYKDDAEFNMTRHCAQLSDALPIFQNDTLMHAPGEKFTYSTFGYVLLGVAVEKVSGLSFVEYLKRNVFAPAGMSSTVADAVSEILPNRARGYIRNDSNALHNAALVDTSCRIPGGGLLSTAADMARFLLATQSGALLKPATVADMWQNKVTAEQWQRTFAGQTVPPGYEPPGIGFGWAIGVKQRKQAIWHGGNQQGSTSIIYLLPTERVGVTILMNLEGQGDEITSLADEIATIVLKR